MRSRIVAVVVLVSLLSGCAHVREIDIDSGASRLAEITAATSGKSVTVELTTGRTRAGEDLDVGVANTCWTERGASLLEGDAEERVCVPTSEVRRIIVPRRIRGGFQGAGIGLGVGAGVFGALYMLSWNWGFAEKLTAALFYALPVEAVIGGVAGAFRGKDIYVLNP